MSDPPTIGFIGLGQAGWPIAANVLAGGLELRVRDLDADRVRRFLEEHPQARALDREGVAGLDVAITMLPDGHVVRDVVRAPGDGLAAALRPGSILVDMSTSDPAGTRALGTELAERDIGLVDAAMSIHRLGGAATRQMTIMLGGDDGAAVERVLPVLGTMAVTIIRVGGLGSGHVVKALNNYISAANFMATIDAIVLGQRCGIGSLSVVDALDASPARNFSTAYTLREEGITRRHRSGFSLALFVKDMGIMLETAAAVGIELPLCAAIRARLAEALAGLGAGADHTEALPYWQRVAAAGDRRGASPFLAGTRPEAGADLTRAISGYVTAVGLRAACDALAVGTRQGLDRTVMLQVFNASTARNWGTSVALAGVAGRDDDGTSDVLARELGAAAELIARCGIDARVCAAVAPTPAPPEVAADRRRDDGGARPAA